MINKIYSIYDSENKTFGVIFLSANEVIMKRQVKNLLLSPHNPYKNFEDKFSVFEMGIFNDEKGIEVNKNIFVVNLKQLLEDSTNIDKGKEVL